MEVRILSAAPPAPRATALSRRRRPEAGGRGGNPIAAPPDAFAPARLGPIALRNRVLKAATFEGMSPDKVVSESLIDFHRRVARGGAALTTVSYIAVSRDGMGAPAEIVIHPGAADGLARIADAVHAEGAAIAAQLGHAGAVGRLPDKRPVGPSAMRTMLGGRVRPLTVGEIDGVVEDFATGARMLARAGFDAIELHFGHHYLISAFLSPRWNRRDDDYGGPLARRAHLALRVLGAARQAAGPGVAISAKLNMTDAVRGGLDVDESLEVARLLEAEGALDALELTGGGSLANPMFLFRGDAPRRDMAVTLPRAQRLGFALLGRFLLRDYPFEEAYFLPLARRFREALSLPLILLGGINRRDTIERAMALGFEFVALGRALLRQPDLVNQLRDGRARAGTCIHCNRCMVSIYSGTRCVIDHPEPLPIR